MVRGVRRRRRTSNTSHTRYHSRSLSCTGQGCCTIEYSNDNTMYSRYYDMDVFWIIAQLSTQQARDAVPSDASSCSDQHRRTRNHHNIQQHAMLPLLPILPAPRMRVRKVTCSITVFWTPLVQLVGLRLRGYCRSPLPGGRFGCSVAPPASPAMTVLLIHTSSEMHCMALCSHVRCRWWDAI